MITITVQGTRLTATTDEPIVAGSVGRTAFTASFDESWQGYAKKIVFASNSASLGVIDNGESQLVPWEVLQRPGALQITAVGIAEGVRCPTAKLVTPLLISYPGKDSEETEGAAPSPSELAQVLLELEQLRKQVRALVEKEPEGTGLPEIKAEDEGSFLGAVDGKWVAAKLPVVVPAATAENNGAFLRSVDGAWRAVVIPNAEGVKFGG